VKRFGKGCLILIGAVVVVVVLIVVIALAAGGGDEGNPPVSNQQPRPVKDGAAFTIGKYSIQPGWKIAREPLGGFTVKGVTIKNTSDETDTVFFTMKVLDGNKVLASIDCNSSEIEPGQEQDGNCFDTGVGKYRTGWDKITVESAF
jgi:hypothetical protein